MVTALLGGHINVYAALGSHAPFVRDKKMRMLVCFNKQRSKFAPEVPTLKDLGYDIQVGMNAVLNGPKGLPEPIVKKLEQAYLEATKNPLFEKYLTSMDSYLNVAGAEATAKGIERDSQIIGRIVKEAGIKEEQK